MNPVEICVFLGKSLSPLFECSPAPIEGVRVRTPMMYPDGGIVDVFVLERGEAYTITDFGDALGWLQMQSVSRGLTKRQNALVGDVCRTLRVELFNGQLVLREIKPEELGDAVIRLAQAVVRVSDVRFTMQPERIKTTADEVDGAQTDGASENPAKDLHLGKWLVENTPRGSGVKDPEYDAEGRFIAFSDVVFDEE